LAKKKTAESHGLKGVKIQIRTKNLPMKKIGEFEDFQGDLKILDPVQKAKLKASIVRNGFNAPIFVWEGHNYILDGHQRLEAVKSLVRDEGMVLENDELPYVEIKANTLREAKEMILTYNSQYGNISPDALAQMLSDLNISPDSLTDFISLPDVNIEEVFFKLGSSPEYVIVERDMDQQEAFMTNPGGGGKSLWASQNFVFSVGPLYTVIPAHMGAVLVKKIISEGMKTIVDKILNLDERFGDDETKKANYLRRVGHVWVEVRDEKSGEPRMMTLEEALEAGELEFVDKFAKEDDGWEALYEKRKVQRSKNREEFKEWMKKEAEMGKALEAGLEDMDSEMGEEQDEKEA